MVSNNKIFLTKNNTIEKHYSTFVSTPCDRGETEFRFISYLYEQGCRCIPKPISYCNNIGTYSYVPGVKIALDKVTRKDINRCMTFLFLTDNFSDYSIFNLAKECCLTPNDYLKMLDKRIKILLEQKPRDKFDKKGIEILKKKLMPIYQNEKKIYKSKIDEMYERNRVMINPGDFGFHNILKYRDKLTFLDFEYSGIDDMIRQGLYFKTGPFHMGMNEKIKKYFVKEYKKLLTKKEIERFDATEPLVNLHWATIQLNFLLPGFMHQTQKFKKNRLSTLNKYIKILENNGTSN
jgi:thiamine kinase-like enzyme